MATILITGASGHIGSAIVQLLGSTDHELRLLTRKPDEITSLPKNARQVVGDMMDPKSLHEAFAGVERMFLMDPTHGQAFTANAVATAKEAGVRHIVDLSTIGADLDPMPIMGQWHFAREQTIKASGIDWTFLRPHYFMTNAFWWINSIKNEGVVRDPIGPGKISSVDPADIAAVAAAALTREGHIGQTYTLTGGELLTIKEEVAILADVLGRDIKCIEITPEEAAQAALGRGMDAESVAASKDLNQALRAGRGEIVTDTIERITGKKPTTFKEWCERNAKAFE